MRRRPFRSGRNARSRQYPFCLLTQPQRSFLNALERPDTLTIGQAFHSGGVLPQNRHGCFEHWLDDSAFIDALFVVQNSLPRVRREQVFTTICEFLHKQPIRRICDVPYKPYKSRTGWQMTSDRRVTSQAQRDLNSLSEGGKDSWT